MSGRVSCMTSWAYISEYTLLVHVSYNLHKGKERRKLWNDSNANTLHNVAHNLPFFLLRHQHNADFENRSENYASRAKKKNSVILLARRGWDTINQLYWQADTNKTRTFHDYSLGFASWLYTLIKHSHLFIKRYTNEFPLSAYSPVEPLEWHDFLVVPIIVPLVPMVHLNCPVPSPTTWQNNPSLLNEMHIHW